MMSNSVSLRRSCKACVKGKRRCDLSLPSCSRCADRRIVCEYTNIPLPAGAESVTSHRHKQVKKYSHINMAHIRPFLHVEILKTHDRATVRFLIDRMRGFPVAFAQYKMTLFIHPHLYDPSLEDIHTICSLYRGPEHSPNKLLVASLRQKSAEIYRQTRQLTSFETLLACVQTLVLIQCMLVFDRDEENAESTNSLLAGLARRLWAQAPMQLPHEMSPRRAWLFAESVRRTIIVSYVLCSVHSLQKQNYSIRTPFVEALPFDDRTFLWDAPSEQSWQEGTSRRPISMVSLREYSDMLASSGADEVTEFGSLVLAACKGMLPSPPVRVHHGS
jgi:hypothetical protein